MNTIMCNKFLEPFARDNNLMGRARPRGNCSGLYVPPLRWSPALSSAPPGGPKLFRPFAGVVKIEAAKQIYADTSVCTTARCRMTVVVSGEPCRIRRSGKSR